MRRARCMKPLYFAARRKPVKAPGALAAPHAQLCNSLIVHMNFDWRGSWHG